MRKENWPELLADTIAKHDALPFEYGTSDCCRLPLDVIEALTGELPDTLLGTYHDAASARTALRERGFDHLAQVFASALREIPPAFAGRGDVGIADYPGAIIGGGVVVVGLDLVGKGYDGTVRLPRSALSRAFRVE